MSVKNLKKQEQTLYDIYSNLDIQNKQKLGLFRFKKDNIITVIKNQIDNFSYLNKTFNNKYNNLLSYLKNFINSDGQILNKKLEQKIIGTYNQNIFKNINLKDIQQITEKEYIKNRILLDVNGLKEVIEDKELEPELVKFHFYDYNTQGKLLHKNEYSDLDYDFPIEIIKQDLKLLTDYPDIEISVNIKTQDILVGYISFLLPDNNKDNDFLQQIKDFIYSDKNKILSLALNIDIIVDDFSITIKQVFDKKHRQIYIDFLNVFLDGFQDLFKSKLMINEDSYITDTLIKINDIIDRIIDTDLNKSLNNILEYMDLDNVFDITFWGKLEQFLENDISELSENIIETFKLGFNPLEQETYFEIEIADQDEYPIINTIWDIDNYFKQYYIRTNNNDFIIKEKHEGKVQDNILDKAIIEYKIKLKLFDIINKMLLAKILFDLGYNIDFNSNTENIIKSKIKFEDIIKYVFVKDRFGGTINGFKVI